MASTREWSSTAAAVTVPTGPPHHTGTGSAAGSTISNSCASYMLCSNAGVILLSSDRTEGRDVSGKGGNGPSDSNQRARDDGEVQGSSSSHHIDNNIARLVASLADIGLASDSTFEFGLGATLYHVTQLRIGGGHGRQREEESEVCYSILSYLTGDDILLSPANDGSANRQTSSSAIVSLVRAVYLLLLSYILLSMISETTLVHTIP
jgi:hypothetical protein